MKWIGQHIYDLISRFRNDVYLEDLTATTETRVLVVDALGKVSYTSAVGDLTAIVAGTGLSGTSLSGPIPTLNVDASIPDITTLAGLTSFGSAGATTNILAGDIDWYNPVADGNPKLNFGFDVNERFILQPYYSGSSLATVFFATASASAIANMGKMRFQVDGTNILDIDDGGIDLSADMGISINGADILTDSSGTATLSNIDAIDATTEATIEAAIDTLTSLTINTDRDAEAGLLGAENIAALSVDFDRATPAGGTHAHNDTGIDLDVNSASLGTSSLYGMDIDVVGATSGTSTAYGIDLQVAGADTNIGMSISTAGTHLELLAYADRNDYATFTVADTGDLTIATVGDGLLDSDLILDADGQIKLEPATGKNILLDGTITIDAGVITGATSITSTAFVGSLTGDASGSSGSCTGQAATVATIAGLAPNTATTQATQGSITACPNLVTVGTIGNGVWNATTIASAKMATGTSSAQGALELATTAEAITGADTTRAVTPAGLKAYADRPAKQIQVYHANFKGNIGASEIFIPLAGVPDENADGSKEQTAIIMPCAGKVKEIILRMNWSSTITTSDDITWKVYNRTKNKRMNGESIIGSSFTMVNPTQGTDDDNNTRTSGEIDYAFGEYDAIAISMEWASTGPTNNADRIYVTVVVENDFTGIGY